ncbi:MAG: hypothetical protein U5R14_10560 [Gemmatimonadota bacterium]|nr:hypothetical protein [Gemmatimonadota bacterium]
MHRLTRRAKGRAYQSPHELRDEGEYEAALGEIERLLDADVQAGSEGYDRLEFLSVLVEHYEDEHHPMGPVTPRQAVAFMLEQRGVGYGGMSIGDAGVTIV